MTPVWHAMWDESETHTYTPIKVLSVQLIKKRIFVRFIPSANSKTGKSGITTTEIGEHAKLFPTIPIDTDTHFQLFRMCNIDSLDSRVRNMFRAVVFPFMLS